MRRQREKLVVVDDGHKFGEVALVTTVISIISTLDSGSGSFSPESLLVDDEAAVVATAGERGGISEAVVSSVSLADELSSDDVFVGFSFVSTF